MQRQAIDCEIILANHLSGKGLVSRICRNPQNSRKQTKRFKKWDNVLHRFHQRTCMDGK